MENKTIPNAGVCFFHDTFGKHDSPLHKFLACGRPVSHSHYIASNVHMYGTIWYWVLVAHIMWSEQLHK